MIPTKQSSQYYGILAFGILLVLSSAVLRPAFAQTNIGIKFQQTKTTNSTQTIPTFLMSRLAVSDTTLSEMEWSYHQGDYVSVSKEWIFPEFADTSWKKIPTSFQHLSKLTKQDWTGIGLFRFHFRVDTAVYNEELVLQIRHRGASEVYVDGKFLGNFGKPAPTRAEEQTMRPYGERSALRLRLKPTQNDIHTIAVRYSDSWAWERSERFFASNKYVGFSLVLNSANNFSQGMRGSDRWYTLMLLMVGGMAALCVLHINLLIFTRWKAHLLYSIFTGGIAFYFGVRAAEKWFEYHVELLFWLLAMNSYVLIAAFIACVGFFYAVFSTKRPIGIWIVGFSPIFFFWIGENIPFLSEGNRGFLGFMALIFLDIMRIVIRAIYRKQKGAWLLGAGGLIFAVFLGAQILWENKYISLPFQNENASGLLVVMSFFSIPLAMSIYLSQKIASTNKELADKLVEVQALTDKTIHQEVERKVLQADNDRKTLELEEARKLQLSMLPQSMPQVQGLDIAMFMQTATEVGGDYYDYFTAADGTLTIAIGDATGHGVKAGTMVAATKSLLAVMAQDETISGSANVLKPSSPILKRMNLRSMFMALSVARIQPTSTGAEVLLANAGMPSALVFRGKQGLVEEVLMKSMPLGTMANFPYEDRQISLHKGDALILMSDGFPERFDTSDEIYGYDNAKAACAHVTGMTAQEIIHHCVRTADEWSKGAPLNDDMTFVVVRVV